MEVFIFLMAVLLSMGPPGLPEQIDCFQAGLDLFFTGIFPQTLPIIYINHILMITELHKIVGTKTLTFEITAKSMRRLSMRKL